MYRLIYIYIYIIYLECNFQGPGYSEKENVHIFVFKANGRLWEDTQVAHTKSCHIMCESAQSFLCVDQPCKNNKACEHMQILTVGQYSFKKKCVVCFELFTLMLPFEKEMFIVFQEWVSHSISESKYSNDCILWAECWFSQIGVWLMSSCWL